MSELVSLYEEKSDSESESKQIRIVVYWLLERVYVDLSALNVGMIDLPLNFRKIPSNRVEFASKGVAEALKRVLSGFFPSHLLCVI